MTMPFLRVRVQTRRDKRDNQSSVWGRSTQMSVFKKIPGNTFTGTLERQHVEIVHCLEKDTKCDRNRENVAFASALFICSLILARELSTRPSRSAVWLILFCGFRFVVDCLRVVRQLCGFTCLLLINGRKPCEWNSWKVTITLAITCSFPSLCPTAHDNEAKLLCKVPS